MQQDSAGHRKKIRIYNSGCHFNGIICILKQFIEKPIIIKEKAIVNIAD